MSEDEEDLVQRLGITAKSLKVRFTPTAKRIQRQLIHNDKKTDQRGYFSSFNSLDKSSNMAEVNDNS